MKPLRSPFFYVGDKYKLMPQLGKLFPKDINIYYEPFCGGGSSFINTNAKSYRVNDIDSYVIRLHKYFQLWSKNPQRFLDMLFSIIEKYNLSCSYKGITAPEELRKRYVKTYFAKYNKDSYIHMRNDFNRNKDNMDLLYLLLIYGFNHMIRFNSHGDFNLPVGNVDFNQNVVKAIMDYMVFLQNNNIDFSNTDYMSFIYSQNMQKNDFVYFDPPYLISLSEYNKLWSIEDEVKLYELIDNLDNNGVKFGITNLVHHKGHTNEILTKWAVKYNVYSIESNYISYNDNSIKTDSKEVYITNV